MAGLVIPCMLCRKTFVWRSAPPISRPFRPLPQVDFLQGLQKHATRAVNRTMHFPILVRSFLTQRHNRTYTNCFSAFRFIWMWTLELHNPLLISRNSIPSSTSYVRMHWISQNYVDLTFVNLFWRSTNRCRNWLQKLLFFGRLCRLSSNALTKKIFLTPLYSFLYDLARTQFSFIPEILQILHLYGLAKYLQSWLKDGSFPDKPAWKKIFRSRTSVSSQHKLQRQDPLSCHTDVFFFRIILGSTEPSSIWKLPRNCYETNLCKFICKLTPSIRDFNEIQVCLLCQKLFTNVFGFWRTTLLI